MKKSILGIVLCILSSVLTAASDASTEHKNDASKMKKWPTQTDLRELSLKSNKPRKDNYKLNVRTADLESQLKIQQTELEALSGRVINLEDPKVLNKVAALEERIKDLEVKNSAAELGLFGVTAEDMKGFEPSTDT